MNIAMLKIGSRLGLTFALILTLLVMIALVGLSNMAEMNSNTKVLVNSDVAKMRLAYQVLDNARASMSRLSGLIAATNEKDATEAQARLSATTAKFDEALTKLVPLLSTPKGKEIYANIILSRQAYVESTTKVLALIAQGSREQASQLAYGGTYKSLLVFVANLREFTDFQEKMFSESTDNSDHNYQRVRVQVVSIAVVALIVSIMAALWITRSITGPLQQAVNIAEKIAAGDLRAKFTSVSEDEIGQLIRALQNMNDSLYKIVAEVRTGTEIIMTASIEIAQGNLDLSARTESQASALEQTAASMQQLTGAVSLTANNAREANTLAAQSADIAAQGGLAVGQIVGTIDDIQEASKKIEEIIGVIDGIAFQTNILALNAAVEAARAGEQGRGFAVVAAEVRYLAQRSALAAKEIKTLIDNSVNTIENGSRQVHEAGVTINNIVVSITQVSATIAEITRSTQEQSQGLMQINQAIIAMENVTQQNAALVEEASAAAGTMQDQSQNLTRLVNVFKLDNSVL